MIEMFKVKRLDTAGRISVNSTSKIKKITATKKNWTENGTRADLIGSNPHSNGEGFSRSIVSFLAISILAKIRMTEITRMVGKIRVI